MIPCICINDQNRPKEIPANKWVQKEKKYHITYVYWHPKQKIQGVDLAEIELDEKCLPYQTFKINRFAIPLSELENFITLCKECTNMNSVDIHSLIEELKTEEIFQEI